MKAFFLVGSVLLTVVILIVGFQNLGINIAGFSVFFTEMDANGTIVVFGVALLGVFAGAFYYGFLNSLLKSDEDEESPGGMS